MSTNQKQTYLNAVDVGFSPLVFQDVNDDVIPFDNSLGTLFVDDFTTLCIGGYITVGTAHTYNYNHGSAFIDLSVSTLALSNATSGEMVATLTATQDVEVNYVAGSNTAAQVEVSTTAPKSWAVEQRVKVSTIATDAGGFFFGVGTYGSAITDTLIDATQLLKTANDFVGFQVAPTAPSTVLAVYKKSGVADASKGTVVAAAHTLVASTYVKFGLKYDAVLNKLSYFVNNVAVGSVSGVNALAAFPTDIKLVMLISGKTGGGSVAPVITVDWIKSVILK